MHNKKVRRNWVILLRLRGVYILKKKCMQTLGCTLFLEEMGYRDFLISSIMIHLNLSENPCIPFPPKTGYIPTSAYISFLRYKPPLILTRSPNFAVLSCCAFFTNH